MWKLIFGRIMHKIAFFAPGGWSLRPAFQRFRGARIGKKVWISQYVYIDENHPEALTLGDNVSLGLRVSIFTHFYWGPRRPVTNMSEVVIEDDVFVGPHCVILPGVRIGKGSVIKAGTVVSRDVPPGVLWGSEGAQALARVTVPLTPEHSYEEFARGLRPIRREPLGEKGG